MPALPRGWTLAALSLILTASPVLAEDGLFRITTLQLQDPHFFWAAAGCTDVTNAIFNQPLQTLILNDSNGDGALDLSEMLLLVPLDPSAAIGSATLTQDHCMPPVSSPTCLPDPSAPSYALTYRNVASGPGLGPVPGTTNPGYGSINMPSGPCFVSDPQTIVLQLGDWSFAFRDAQIAAQYSGTPASGLVTGLMRGFLTEADAAVTLVPASAPLLGGTPLRSLLQDGTGCTAFSDEDTGPSGEKGWWFYFNFTALRATDATVPVRPSTWGAVKVRYR